MDDHNHIPLFLKSIVTISFVFLTTLPTSISQDDRHRVCNNSYNCGEITSIYYPFWGENRPSYCGSNPQLKLNCDAHQNITSIQLGSQSFKVRQIQQYEYTLKLVRTDLVYDRCSSRLTNASLDSSFFRYMPNVKNITIFYDCPSASELSNGSTSFRCQEDGNNSAFYVENTALPEHPEVRNCEGVRIEVQVTQELGPQGGIEELNKTLDAGFDVKYIADYERCYRCLAVYGTCGTNDNSQFSCYCESGNDASECSDHRNKGKWKTKVSLGVAAAVVSGLAVGIICCIYQRRKKNFHAVSSIQFQSQNTSYDPSLKDTEKGTSKYFGLHVFSYNELEEATNYFDSSRELGDGGFGTVYFGKLQDGRFVAVKRLYEHNCRRLEQFMNEVEILTGLRHQNLVSLYGCTSRHSRELLLVYEYIPNGTVADHLHGHRAKPGTLPWHIRMNIAIETASALVYLHASDIIHRDVKTNNILLDDHFRVKVADFGLSRLFPNHVTHISTAPQGTPGYVDPEYHEYYQLTDKSDVYSFGVVLIELISSMPAVDISRHRHEINLSNMAINKIRSGALHELVDPTLGFESDFEVRKMINAVAELAFQCLQSSKDVRPSMIEVLDTLKDIQSDGNYKSEPEVMDMSADDDDGDALLVKNEPPPPSPDSNLVVKCEPPSGTG